MAVSRWRNFQRQWTPPYRRAIDRLGDFYHIQRCGTALRRPRRDRESVDVFCGFNLLVGVRCRNDHDPQSGTVGVPMHGITNLMPDALRGAEDDRGPEGEGRGQA